MLVEYAESPLAIGTRRPRFSWEVPLAGRGRRQTACQLLVATKVDLLAPAKADLWDSGKVDSAQSVNVAYAGAGLRSNTDCFWSVQVWDERGEAQGFCAPRRFGTALLDKSDWGAQWIGMGPATEPELDPYCLQQDDGSAGLQLTEEDMGKLGPGLRDLRPEQRSPLLRRIFKLAKPASCTTVPRRRVRSNAGTT